MIRIKLYLIIKGEGEIFDVELLPLAIFVFNIDTGKISESG
jgi:hypothetical protein